MDASTRQRLVVALDGPGSSGKSSVGAAAALEVGYRFCDTGLLYRAVTWLALARNLSASYPHAVHGLVDEVELAPDEAGRLSRVLVDGDRPHRRRPQPGGRRGRVGRVRDPGAAPRAPGAPARARRGWRDRHGRARHRDGRPARRRPQDLPRGVGRGARAAADRGTRARSDGPGGRRPSSRRSGGATSSTRPGPSRPSVPATDARIISTDGNRFEDTVDAVVNAIRDAEARRAAEPTPSRAGHMTDEEPIDSSLTPLIRVLTFGGRIFGRAMSRVRLEGAIDEIPADGPLILAANHASNLDAIVIGSWLIPKLGRRIHWLGKKELFAWPIVGWTAAHGGVHPVDRGARGRGGVPARPADPRRGQHPVRLPGGDAQPGRRAPGGAGRRRGPRHCGPARRSSRSGSPARTASGRRARSCRTRAVT